MAEKLNEKTRLKKEMDRIWYAAQHRRWKRCAVSGESPVEIHHLISKARLATAWMEENRIGLTAKHHRLSQEFSAHKTKKKFLLWLKDRFPEKWAWYEANRERVEPSVDLKQKLEELRAWAL